MRRLKDKKTTAPRRRIDTSDSSRTDKSFFLRNRTLTGSLSHTVRSTNEHGSQLKSPRVHVHHLARTRRRVGILLVATVIVALILYILVSQFTAHVRVVLRGFPGEDVQAVYQETLQDYLNRQPLERLRFAVDLKKLVSYVQTEHPEVKSIGIEASSEFATSTVTITARRPITGWNTAGHSEYVDEDGIAFQHSYYGQPALQIVDDSNIPLTSGQAIASDRFLGFVGLLVGEFHRQGHRVMKIVIPADTTREIDISLSGVAYTIKCSVDRSAGQQAEDIKRVVAYLKHHNIHPQYVDVRVEGRAYYR